VNGMITKRTGGFSESSGVATVTAAPSGEWLSRRPRAWGELSADAKEAAVLIHDEL